jgi:putative ABC transport system permease protein
MYSMNLGVDSSNLLTLQLFLPLTKYPQPGPRADVYQRMEERMRSVPGVQSGTITTNVPLGGGFPRELAVEGRTTPSDEAHHNVTMVTVGDTYFDTMEIPLMRGRVLNSQDGLPGHEAAVVNQRFVAMHFTNEDPIGRRIQLKPVPLTGPEPPWTTIVGVVPSVRQAAFREREPDPVVYLPYRADAQRFGVMIVRTAGDPARVTASLRDAMRGIEPDLPLYDVQTMDAVLARSRWVFNVFGTMFAVFAGIALVLSTVGLYAVTAYSVTQRRQEIGVRMALGGQPRSMLWLVLKRALMQLAIGLPLGLAGAVAVGRLLDSILLEGGSQDVGTLAAIAVVLIVAATAACVWPAQRAARLDPVIALRGE